MLRPLVIALLTLMAVAAPAAGQTTTSSHEGAFDRLSPANQKIAQALYDGQGETKALSRDQIAAMKQDGKGWGVIFQGMKADGQLPADAKNLGQLVSGRYPSPGRVIAGTGGSVTVDTKHPKPSKSATSGGGGGMRAGAGRGK